MYINISIISHILSNLQIMFRISLSSLVLQHHHALVAQEAEVDLEVEVDLEAEADLEVAVVFAAKSKRRKASSFYYFMYNKKRSYMDVKS
jgi:hypothetical protein